MLPVHILLLYSSLALQMVFGLGQITPVELLKDPQTMLSKNGTYMLGFFSPPNTSKRYLGIWYNRVSPTYHVWVANRNKPLLDSSGVLRLSKDGNLEVLDGRNNSLWSVNVSLPAPNSTRNIEFLDSGNLRLVDSYSNVRNSTGSSVLWQSFDNPTDSLLPGMRITMQSSNMIRMYSWESLSDPSNGSFSLGLDSSTHPQLVLWNGNQRHYRSGPWNGNIFLGMLYTDASTDYADTSIQNNDAAGQVTLVYTEANQLALSHYYFSYDGYLNEVWWDSGKSAWQTLYRAPDVDCDFYGKCGAFGTCNTKKSPICRCLKGFVPKNSIEWNRGNWSSGCVRRTTLQCGKQGGEPDGFSVMKTVKLPDLEVWMAGLSPIDCRSQCLNNCSCLAYAYDAGAGCMYWSTQLIDIQEFTSGGIDLFLRLAHSELGTNNNNKVIISAAVIGGTAFIALVSILLWMWLNRRKANAARRKMILNNLKHRDDRSQRKLEDLPLYDFKVLVAATKNFDESQKLGEGGFGQVYKGRFENGQEIAVKRLSATSGQGMEEFTNEVVVISRLQHKNLVSLLGFCVEGDEKLLVYEYMHNKSLSAFLFDSTKREVLDWTKRFNIVEGICRGLIYLHRDSRLRIIHRDLKASNILLDEQLNPKIADFGMARIFGHGQDQDETRRVVGTYGYMAPEYAMGGHFSEKSDVYSFGVLLLEIITAKRNITFWFEEESLTLLGYVWKLWAEDNVHLIIDPIISDPLKWKEIDRFIQVGLLCVQENVKDRPSMSTVLSMLSSEIADLPSPKRPGFNIRQMFMDTHSSQLHNISQDNISITTISGR